MLYCILAFLGKKIYKGLFENGMSRSLTLQTGLPQGSVTTCTLFNHYSIGLASEPKFSICRGQFIRMAATSCIRSAFRCATTAK